MIETGRWLVNQLLNEVHRAQNLILISTTKQLFAVLYCKQNDQTNVAYLECNY